MTTQMANQNYQMIECYVSVQLSFCCNSKVIFRNKKITVVLINTPYQNTLKLYENDTEMLTGLEYSFWYRTDNYRETKKA